MIRIFVRNSSYQCVLKTSFNNLYLLDKVEKVIKNFFITSIRLFYFVILD